MMDSSKMFFFPPIDSSFDVKTASKVLLASAKEAEFLSRWFNMCVAAAVSEIFHRYRKTFVLLLDFH